MIRKRGGSLQVQVFAGRDPLTGRKRWLSRQVRGQTKAAWREAKKVEAQLLEQLDRDEQRGGRTRTVGELVERWLEWRQQVRPVSPVTVANSPGPAPPRRSTNQTAPAAGRCQPRQCVRPTPRSPPPDAEEVARLLTAAMDQDPELGPFLRLAVVLGVRRSELIALRHFMVTQLVAGGLDWRTVSGRAGHANGHMTLATYAHFRQAQDRQAAELMERLIQLPEARRPVGFPECQASRRPVGWLLGFLPAVAVWLARDVSPAGLSGPAGVT